MKRRSSLERWLVWVVVLLLGAMIGRLAMHQFGAVFAPVQSLDQQKWRVISPGLLESIQHPGRGSHLGGGALVLVHHVFYQSDRVVPILPRPPTQLVVELAPDSSGLSVLLGQPPNGVVTLHPSGVETSPGNFVSGDGTRTFAVGIDEGMLWVDGGNGRHSISSVSPDRLELAGSGGSARIRSIQIADAAGVLMLDERFEAVGMTPRMLNFGTVVGALIGLVVAGCFFAAPSFPTVVWMGLMLAPIGAVFALPASRWLSLLERLYLTDISPSVLAARVACLAMIPVFVGACILVLRALWQWVDTRRSLRGSNSRTFVLRAWSICVVCAGAATALGEGEGLSPWLVVGLIWMLLPLWVRRSIPSWTSIWMGVDLLALLAIALFGWGPGLLIAVGIRISMVISGVRWLYRSAAQPAVGFLVLMLMSILPGIELTLRDTALNTAWDPTQLTEERPSQMGWMDPQQSWSARCGPEDALAHRTLMFAGGSSTGGAYQFKNEPEVFFPAQAHAHLCTRLPPDTALQTVNFGRGNRDTFTIARTIDRMLEQAPADQVILYVGVNDLLASHQPLTRKQREAQRDDRSRAVAGLAWIGARSRIVTGAWLLTREIPDADQPGVPDVPVPDAIDNFNRVADVVLAQGGSVLLTTEFVSGTEGYRMDAYRDAQASLGQHRDGVEFLDVRAVFDGYPEAEILVDQNHLTRLGNAMLGRVLADWVGAAWDWPDAQGSSR